MRTVEKLLVGFVVVCALVAVIGVATAPLRAQETPPAPPAVDGAIPVAPAETAPMQPPATAEGQGGPGLTPPASPPGTPPAAGGTTTGAPPTQVEVKPTPPAVDYRKDADRQKAEFRADIARRKHPWDKREMYENERAWERNIEQNEYNCLPAHKDMGGTCGSTWWHEYCGN